ncbi:Alpha/Beta hydrolase protein [Leptodontidium sp. MPI-SDFR-AT-0119]|nr:Alpha/Beta hydrolase protein [Leptodontidium sp. MPI-SDFR-AT-0119]
MARVSQIQTDDGISWYVEQSGSGQHIVLIPSGEGDCHAFGALAKLLSPMFKVTTFDMPGFSRSVAPSSALEKLSPKKGADQIVSLMDKLEISKATIYGSSSGGLFALAMLQSYEDRVERIIIHEVPMTVIGGIRDWEKLPASEDGMIVAHCQELFANVMNEDATAWEGLGPEYHKRLEKNFVTWAKTYVPVVDEAIWDKEELKVKRGEISWTLGGLTPLGIFYENLIIATEVGIAIKVLKCKHFPYVSIPGVLADYIRDCCK